MKRGAAPCVAPRPSAGWLVFAVFVVMASRGVALAAGARIEFATAEAVGRGIHPVRLFVDATGPRRETPLALDAPPGTRFMRPPPASVPEGASAPEVLIFHLLVPAGAAAGVLDLHGSLGGTPLRAMLPVRGLPDFQVLGAPRERLIGFGGGGIPVTLVVRNRGNTALSFRAFSQTGDNGPRVAIESDSFTLDAGGERKVSLAVLPPEQARAATEGTAAVLFEGRAEGFERTDPVVLNTLHYRPTG